MGDACDSALNNVEGQMSWNHGPLLVMRHEFSITLKVH